jgi:SAM-dependent methyltransferase
MAFEELKQMQGVMWGEGNFDEVADSIEDVHAAVAQAALPAVGERWLDVACGTGRVAEIAAAGGAERELDIEYRVGDAERLDVPDASFDVVTSSFGVMFAPSQEVAAGELARVTKPGGRLSLSCWTPEGRIGGMFRVQGAFAPAPPPSIPVDWGREDHVQQLLGTSFDLSFERRITVEEWESGEAMWAFFAPRFGPVTTLVKKLPPDKAEEFKQAMIAYSEEAREGDKIIDRREYLLITGTRV